MASAAFAALMMNELRGSPCSQGRWLPSLGLGQGGSGARRAGREALSDASHRELLPAGTPFHLGLQSLEG